MWGRPALVPELLPAAPGQRAQDGRLSLQGSEEGARSFPYLSVPLWWVGLGWLPDAHPDALSLPLLTPFPCSCVISPGTAEDPCQGVWSTSSLLLLSPRGLQSCSSHFSPHPSLPGSVLPILTQTFLLGYSSKGWPQGHQGSAEPSLPPSPPPEATRAVSWPGPAMVTGAGHWPAITRHHCRSQPWLRWLPPAQEQHWKGTRLQSGCVLVP